ncbi:MAG: ammonium transporter, Amt family [Acidimicrobiaceae bacterium]|jgi:Amt family ammonium transporter
MIKKRLQRLRGKSVRDLWQDRETRRIFGLLLAGKMIGILTLLGAIKGVSWYFGSAAGATPLQTPAAQTDSFVSPINTIWVLVTAFLVFFMQAGFMALEAGFARSRESVNVLLECVFDTCLCGLLYWAVGFAFQFGLGNGFIGHSYFFLNGAPDTYTYGGLLDTQVAFLAFFLFQFAFADTASTVTSGAMVGRTSFKGDILYSMAVSGLIYPIFAHWVWGPQGWLGNTMGWFSGFVGDGIFFRDFAGSTVVHTVGGTIALAGAFVLGPRLGRKFKRDGGGPLPPHDLVMATIGATILWFGWYGFNPGSTLSGMDFVGIGRVAANTTLAACAGGMVAVLFVYPRSKKWDLGMSLNGFLGGLVAITCPCYWVSPGGAIWIGAIAGIVVPLGVDLLEYLRIDDPIGAVAVHMFSGIWGTLSLGLFATGQFGLPTPTGADNETFTINGLFYGGGADQLKAQFVGSITCVVVVGAVSLILFKIIRAIPGSWNLRIDKDGELEGMDIHEHGSPAYHMEFGQGMTYTTLGAGTFGKGADSEKVPASEGERV